MNEKLQSDEPATYVADQVKAEHMAIAEKPHRDDAIVLGQMAVKAEAAYMADRENLGKQANGSAYTYNSGKGNLLNSKTTYLEDARVVTTDAAQRAGEVVGEAYDQAQVANAQAQAANARLEGLTQPAVAGQEVSPPQTGEAPLPPQ